METKLKTISFSILLLCVFAVGIFFLDYHLNNPAVAEAEGFSEWTTNWTHEDHRAPTWYDGGDGSDGEPFIISSPALMGLMGHEIHANITGNITLVSVLDAIFTVTFMLVDGTTVAATRNAYFEHNYVIQNFPLVGNPIGSINARWVIVSGGTIGNTLASGDTVSANMTVRAVWEWTVIFDVDGGVPATIPNQEIEHGEKVTAPILPTREGFIFRYWAHGTVFSFDTFIISNITLVAVWDAIFTLTFENLSGATHENRTTFTVMTPTFMLENPSTRAGWTFVGWYTALTGGSRMTQITLGTTNNRTLYARWADARPAFPDDFDREEIENYLPENWTPEDGWPEHPFPYGPPENWMPEDGFPWMQEEDSWGDNVPWWGWLSIGGAIGATAWIILWLLLFKKKTPKEGN